MYFKEIHGTSFNCETFDSYIKRAGFSRIFDVLDSV